MKEKELKVLGVKKCKLNSYDSYVELKLDNKEYILISMYLYNLDEFEAEDEIDMDEISEQFVILEKSIIEKIKIVEDLIYDEFYDAIEDARIEKRFSNVDVLNQYVRIINETLYAEV